MTNTKLPEQKHVYQNHNLNSPHWDQYVPRSDDIIIATSLKAGTTWMQNIVAGLIFQGKSQPKPTWELSPWLEVAWPGFDDKLAGLEAQTHRRFIKTHLPLDGLPYHQQVKYIYVGRPGLDIFMSLWNHHQAMKPEIIETLNNSPDLVGDPFPSGPEDIHEFFQNWVSKGWFPWEQEGYPYWTVLYHAQSWFDYRHLDNILLVHFNDLLEDLGGEIRRIAGYLEIEINEPGFADLVESLTFKSMKARAEQVVPGAGESFVGGARRFLHKGKNGRWRDVLSEEEVEMYERKVEAVLTPECARWLEGGRHAIG